MRRAASLAEAKPKPNRTLTSWQQELKVRLTVAASASVPVSALACSGKLVGSRLQAEQGKQGVKERGGSKAAT